MLIGVRPVDGSVAIAAAAQEGAGPCLTEDFAILRGVVLRDGLIAQNAARYEVVVEAIGHTVAGHAEAGLRGLQQRTADGAVWVVADPAVFHCGRVLEDPGPHDVLMASRAAGIAITVSGALVAVGVVTVEAAHGALSYGVVRGILESRRDVLVAFDAQL